MTIIYDVIAKRHSGNSRPDVCLFYDEDREKSIEFMKKYAKKKGFVIEDKDGVFTIADIILRERESTGKKLSDTSYRELFDAIGKRLKPIKGGKSNVDIKEKV